MALKRINKSMIDQEFVNEVAGLTTQLAHVIKHKTCSEIGLNTLDDGLNNFTLLTQAMEENIVILIDGFYKLKRTSPYTFTHDIQMRGISEDAGFELIAGDMEWFFTTTTNNLTIDIQKVKWKSETTNRNIVFNILDTDVKITSVKTFNCEFEGNVSYFRYRGLKTLNPTIIDYGVETFIFRHNKITNAQMSLIWLVDNPHELIDFSYNTVVNFYYYLLDCTISNDHSHIAELQKSAKNLNATHNKIMNDDDCIHPEQSTAVYYSVVIYEGQTAVYSYNHIEGMKTFNGNVALHDAYLSAKNVYYSNNVWKNNVHFALPSGAFKFCLIKAKQNAGSDVGYRLYDNNKFIIEESFVLKFTSDLINSRVQLYENTDLNDYDIINNTIEVCALVSQTWGINDAKIRKLKFKGNILSTQKYTISPLFDIGSYAEEYDISNNEISINDTTLSFFRLIQGLDVNRKLDKITVLDNKIYLKTKFRLLDTVKSRELTFRNELNSGEGTYTGTNLPFYDCVFDKSLINYELTSLTDVSFLYQEIGSPLNTNLIVKSKEMKPAYPFSALWIPTTAVSKSHTYIVEMEIYGETDSDYYKTKTQFKLYNSSGVNRLSFKDSSGANQDVAINSDALMRTLYKETGFPIDLRFENKTSGRPMIYWYAPSTLPSRILNIKIRTIEV